MFWSHLRCMFAILSSIFLRMVFCNFTRFFKLKALRCAEACFISVVCRTLKHIKYIKIKRYFSDIGYVGEITLKRSIFMENISFGNKQTKLQKCGGPCYWFTQIYLNHIVCAPNKGITNQLNGCQMKLVWELLDCSWVMSVFFLKIFYGYLVAVNM